MIAALSHLADMRHAPFILGAYGVTLATGAALSIGAWLRLGRARRRLAAIDRTPGRLRASGPDRGA